MRDIVPLLIKKAESTKAIRSSRHAAAIVYKGIVLSYGVNSLKTHPIMKLYGRNKDAIYLHAEIDAIVKVINRYGTDILSKSTLHVIRIGRCGQLASSKPCKGCQKAIEAFKIKQVIHS